MVYYLLYKYNMKELISKAEMLREVIQMYRNHYLEILPPCAVTLQTGRNHFQIVYTFASAMVFEGEFEGQVGF